MDTGSEVNNCANTSGTISGTYSGSELYVGGIVGYNSGTIKNQSRNQGQVTVNNRK